VQSVNQIIATVSMRWPMVLEVVGDDRSFLPSLLYLSGSRIEGRGPSVVTMAVMIQDGVLPYLLSEQPHQVLDLVKIRPGLRVAH
jgi:hypothetical protein